MLKRDGTLRRDGGKSLGFGNRVNDYMTSKGRKPLPPNLIEAMNKSGAEAAQNLKANKKIIVENMQMGAAWFKAWGEAEGDERKRIFTQGPLRYAKEICIYPDNRTPKEDAELVRTCRDTIADLLRKDKQCQHLNSKGTD